MSDDERLAGLIRRAGGSTGDAPDLATIARRARRRRVARITTGVAAAVAVLAAVAVVAFDTISTSRTVRFAQAGRQAAASPSAAGRSDAGGVAAPRPSPAPSDPRETVDEVPEGALVAVPDGFVIVSGNVPAEVWFSRDARAWTVQEAQGLDSDVPSDVAATPDGAIAVLDVTPALWTSDDRGRSWRRVDLPRAVAGAAPTQVAGDATSWFLAGSRPGEAFVFAVARDAPGEYRRVEGDLAHGRDLLVPEIAAGGAGAVLTADGRRPAVWYIAPSLAVTPVAGVFGDARITAVAARADGFVATVAGGPEAGRHALELWTSPDGVAWSRAGGDVPAPTCAQLAASGRRLLAAGRPCDADAGWQAWLRDGDGDWERIE